METAAYGNAGAVRINILEKCSEAIKTARRIKEDRFGTHSFERRAELARAQANVYQGGFIR